MRIKLIILIIFLIYGCNTQEDIVIDNEAIETQEENAVLESQEAELLDEDIVAKEMVPEEFLITDEIYEETFNDINNVINELNSIINSENYDLWLNYLTENYIIETSRPSYLEKWENDKNLQESGIIIHSLNDYFYYLVVPRRFKAQLDTIEFIDENRVHAYTVINGVQYLLYNLVRKENGWKIDFY